MIRLSKMMIRLSKTIRSLSIHASRTQPPSERKRLDGSRIDSKRLGG